MNSNTLHSTTYSPQMAQAQLQTQLVLDPIATVAYSDQLGLNRIIQEQYISPPRGGTYTVGTGAPAAGVVAVPETYTIDQTWTAAFTEDRFQNSGVQDPNWISAIERDGAYEIARKMNQWGLDKIIAGAPLTISIAGRLSSQVLRDALQEADERVKEAGAGGFKSMRYLVHSPSSAGFVLEDYITNIQDPATLMGLREGAQGFMGTKYMGRMQFQTDEYKHTLTLTIGSNPSNGQILKLLGGSLTITFVTALTVGNYNEVKIGATKADTQTNLYNFLSDTTNTATANYGVMTAEQRAQTVNAGLAITTFASDVATVTKYGRIRPDTSATTAGTWGTESYSMIVGSKEGFIMTASSAPMYGLRPTVSSSGYTSFQNDHLLASMGGGRVRTREGKSLVVLSNIQY